MNQSSKFAPKLLLMILIITTAFIMSTIVTRADDSVQQSESPASTESAALTEDSGSSSASDASSVAPEASSAPAVNPPSANDSATDTSVADGSTSSDSSVDSSVADGSASSDSSVDGSADDGSTVDGSADDGSTVEEPSIDGSLSENTGDTEEDGLSEDPTTQEDPELQEGSEKPEDSEESEEVVADNKANTSVGWHTVNKQVRYYYTTSKYYKSTVVKINGKLYGFDSNGAKLTNGVYKVGNYYYHFNSSGYVTTTVGFVSNGSDKYFVKNSNGVLALKEIVTVNGKSYGFSSYSKLLYNRVYSLNSVYRSADSEGAIRCTVGFITVGNNKYYIKNRTGALAKNEILKINGTNYAFGSNAVMFRSQAFKLNGTYRYAYSSGAIRTKKGFYTTSGKTYYVKSSSGTLACNQLVKVKGKTYAVGSTARFMRGGVKVGKTYYFCNKNYTINKNKGWHSYGGKKYYARKGGALYYSKIISVGGKKYYMGSNAAVRIGSFTSNYVKYTTDSNGVIKSAKRITMKGIDVSYAQGKINWTKVKAAGIDFAFIRVGYRASASGSLEEDDWFRTNMAAAKKAGIKVGVYFFSVATTASEAKAEADYTAKLIKSTGYSLDLPMVIDSETCPFNTTRAKKYNNLSASARTTVVKAFLDRTKELGYTPMVYASTSWLENKLNMSKLSSYKVWVAQYNSRCTYDGKYACWQYTSSGYVNGISGRVDMNIWYN